MALLLMAIVAVYMPMCDVHAQETQSETGFVGLKGNDILMDPPFDGRVMVDGIDLVSTLTAFESANLELERTHTQLSTSHEQLSQTHSTLVDAQDTALAQFDAVRKWVCGSEAFAPTVLYNHTSSLASIWSIAVDSKDEHMFVGAKDQTVRQYLVSTPSSVTLQHTYNHPSPVHVVAITSDATTLFSGTRSGNISVWYPASPDPTSGNTVLTEHADTITALALSPMESFLVSASFDGTVRVWNLLEPAVAHSHVLPSGEKPQYNVVCLAFVPWTDAVNDTLVGGGTDGVVRVWQVGLDPNSTALIHELESQPTAIQALATSPTRLYAATAQGTVVVWDVSSAQSPPRVIFSIQAHEEGIQSLAISNDFSQLFSAALDLTVRSWDLSASTSTPMQLIRTLASSNSLVRSLEASNNSTRVYLGTDRGAVSILHVNSCFV
eukprot:m.78215 g.78215  ORF g.78215 m.78215 type:complete len:437 (+) comp12526_c0_seq1:72-1382(+)